MDETRHFTRPKGVWVDPPTWKKWTAPARLPPTFLVIGAQRSGTTSLFRYLSMHPCIVPPLRKEVHYFDFQYRKGRAWYLAHFPGRVGGLRGTRPRITGEASPYYMVHPLAPERVRAFDAGMKLIAILRDPVDRAWSHYHREVRAGAERLSFEEAIEAEEGRLSAKDRRLRAAPFHYCFNHHHFSYLDRGLYARHLETWLRHFPRENLLVARSEDLFADPNAVANRVFAFLHLPPHEIPADAGRTRPYRPMKASLRERLHAHFAPDQRRLAELLA